MNISVSCFSPSYVESEIGSPGTGGTRRFSNVIMSVPNFLKWSSNDSFGIKDFCGINMTVSAFTSARVSGKNHLIHR